MENKRIQELKIAERGAMVSIATYILLAILKVGIGKVTHSAALSADGLNNFTDILGSCAVLAGLRIARRPADKDHAYGHWKLENVASMLTSFIMLMVGIGVLNDALQKILSNHYDKPEPVAALVGVFGGLLMFFVYQYNKKLAKQMNSNALLAAAKDNLSDVYTSIGTSVAVLAAFFQLPIIDSIGAIIIAFVILKTALEVFKDSAFTLSDGFDEEKIETYKNRILQLKDVKKVRAIRGRSYGANIFLDVVVEMDPLMTVLQSHYITEIIEKTLHEEFGVFDTDVHVEPFIHKEENENE